MNIGAVVVNAVTAKLTTARLFIILIIGFGILLYIIDLSTLRLSQFRFSLATEEDEEDQKWNWQFVDDMDRENRLEFQSYFVNNDGCRMPSFKVVDANVEKFMFDVKAIRCRKPLTRSNNNYLWIDLNATEIETVYGVKDVENLLCTYEPFYRKNDFTNGFSNQKVSFRFGDVVKVIDEFIRVVCRVNGRTKDFYHDYHYFVQSKSTSSEMGENNSAANEPDESVDDETKKTTPMSVMIMGLDSLSRLNFHRRMNDTVDFLLNELRAIELFGYNKVADNTYPNLMPTLTGLDENELVTACIPTKNHTFDRCHFIWNVFKQKNYVTAYVEDMASLGLFQYLRRGFTTQPTDYSLRPVMIEMEHHIANHKSVNTHLCMGGRRTFDVLMEYAQKFVSFMTTRSKQAHFSFFWTTSYTHDYLNYPTLIDTDFSQFLRTLHMTGALDNTFLILMSDHGIRWGSFRSTYQGRMEERQPFLYLVPPKWFPEKYPAAMRNLVRNRRKLTTPFDLYETLRHLAEIEALETPTIKLRAKELRETEPMPRGISLFLPIPSSRNCYNAEIAPHWCTCHEKAELPATDPRVSQVARLMVDHMNELIKDHPQCQRLRLNSVFDANLGMSNTSFRNVSNHFVDITVRLQTKPSLGEFEATVRIHDNNAFELTGTISRTNLYGKQSYCIDDFKLKLYCFCDSLT